MKIGRDKERNEKIQAKGEIGEQRHEIMDNLHCQQPWNFHEPYLL